MQKLTEKQLFHFQNCPALFEMIYVKKLPIQEKRTLSSYLGMVSSYFYTNALDGKRCSNADLKRKWDSICNKYNLSQKEALDGMQEIIRFSNWISGKELVLAGVDIPYSVVIGDVELQGNLSPVFTTNNKKEIIILDFSSKVQDQRVLDMKLKYTIDAYAFRELYGEEIVGIRIHHVKTNKTFLTNRNELDFYRLKTTVKGIGAAIEAKGYYARDSFMCPSCPAFSYCRYWTREE